MIPRIDPLALGAMALLGAWVGADTVALIQLMVSQPLVAAWLGGWVGGDPLSGLVIGILLQGIWIRGLPVGGITLPWTGPAALVGGYLATLAGKGSPLPGGILEIPPAPVLIAIVMAAWGTAEVGRLLVRALHRDRRGLVRRAEASAEAGDPGGVVRANLAGLGPVAGLGALVTVVGVLLGMLLIGIADRMPAADGRWPALVLLGYGVGQGLSTLGSRRRILLGLAGVGGVCALAWGLG